MSGNGNRACVVEAHTINRGISWNIWNPVQSSRTYRVTHVVRYRICFAFCGCAVKRKHEEEFDERLLEKITTSNDPPSRLKEGLTRVLAFSMPGKPEKIIDQTKLERRDDYFSATAKFNLINFCVITQARYPHRGEVIRRNGLNERASKRQMHSLMIQLHGARAPGVLSHASI